MVIKFDYSLGARFVSKQFGSIGRWNGCKSLSRQSYSNGPDYHNEYEIE